MSIFQNNMVIPSSKLVEYNSYYLKINNVNNLILMYVLPSVENEIYDLECQQISKITIGSDPINNIHYPNELVLSNHCEIIRQEKEVTLNVTNDEAQVFVNNKRITSCTLKTGDIIFIHGLKIIWINSFIRINNPKKLVRIQGFNFYNNNMDNSIYEPENELEEVELYKQEEYFSPKFRVNNQLVEETVEKRGITFSFANGN